MIKYIVLDFGKIVLVSTFFISYLCIDNLRTSTIT